MADYAPNYTGRYKVRYSSLGREHTMQFRQARANGTTANAALIAAVTSFLDALATLRFTDWTVIDAQFAAPDQDFFLAATAPTPVPGTAVLPTVPSVYWPRNLNFPGRSANGGRGIVYVFGLLLTMTDNAANADYRFTAAENVAVSNAVSALNGLSVPIVANDDGDLTFYAYANVGFNDYWLGEARG